MAASPYDALYAADPHIHTLFTVHMPNFDPAVHAKPSYVGLVGVILGQKVSLTIARALRRELYEFVGYNNVDDITLDGMQSYLDYKQSGRGQKILAQTLQCLVNVQTYICTHLTDVGFDLGRRYLEIADIEFVGPWTMHGWRLVSMHHLLGNPCMSGCDSGPWEVDPALSWINYFPKEDSFIRQKMKELYGLPKMPTPAQAEKMSLSWAPFRGVVAWYLWRWGIE